MTDYKPQPRERVLAVLPDGHEIEAEYYYQPTYPGSTDRWIWAYLVLLNGDSRHAACVSSVKPLPVTEPTVFGACVIDTQGRRWISVGRVVDQRRGWWYCEEGLVRHWPDLIENHGPVRVVNADPWSES